MDNGAPLTGRAGRASPEPASGLGHPATIPSADECARLQRERDYAVRWANQSVDMLKEAFFPVADALRDLEAYLRNTPHHNAIEAAAARKALAKFDEVQS